MDGVFLSEELGFEKPDIRFFEGKWDGFPRKTIMRSAGPERTDRGKTPRAASASRYKHKYAIPENIRNDWMKKRRYGRGAAPGRKGKHPQMGASDTGSDGHGHRGSKGRAIFQTFCLEKSCLSVYNSK